MQTQSLTKLSWTAGGDDYDNVILDVTDESEASTTSIPFVNGYYVLPPLGPQILPIIYII